MSLTTPSVRPHSLSVTAIVTALVLGLLGLVAPTAPSAAASSARVADTAPPVLVDFSFTPQRVNIATEEQEVVVTARVTDETGTQAPTMVLLPEVGAVDESAGFGSMDLTAGTSQDGTWTGTATIPTTASRGAWTVKIYSLVDVNEYSDQTEHDNAIKLTVADTDPGPTAACVQARSDVQQAKTLVKKLSTALAEATKQLSAAEKQLKKAKAMQKKAAIKKAKRKVAKAEMSVERTTAKKKAAQRDLAGAQARVDATC